MKAELNGFTETFYLLGDLCARSFVSNDDILFLTSDPLEAKRFSTYSEASSFYKAHKADYYNQLYPQEIKLTVEYL